MSNDNKNRRIFIGIPVEPRVAEELERLQAQWRDILSLPRETQVSKTDFHLTLHFLGSVQAHQIEIWRKTLEIHSQLSSFSFLLNRFLPFPDSARARVITLAGASGNSPLSYLFYQLAQTVVSLGAKVESRVFIPHITLFRGREFKIQRSIEAVPSLEIKITRFALYESFLEQSENRYSILREYLLKP